MSDTYTYGQVHKLLEASGVTYPYSSFTALMRVPGVTELLGITGTGNRMFVPPESVEILKRFLPTFLAAGAKPRAAPSLLSSYLNRGLESSPLVPVHAPPEKPAENLAEQPLDLSRALPVVTDLSRSLCELASALRGSAALAPAEDRLIDSLEAGALLACSPRSVSRHVKPVRRGVFRRSDILRYIASLNTD